MNRLVVVASTLLCVMFSAIQALAGVSLTLSPQNPQVPEGRQLQFLVTVSGTTNNVVIWSVTGAGCSGVACGVIDDQGLYTAPAKAPSPSSGNGSCHLAGRCHSLREFLRHHLLAYKYLCFSIANPGCSRDWRATAVFCPCHW